MSPLTQSLGPALGLTREYRSTRPLPRRPARRVGKRRLLLLCEDAGFRYFAIGPALPRSRPMAVVPIKALQLAARISTLFTIVWRVMPR